MLDWLIVYVYSFLFQRRPFDSFLCAFPHIITCSKMPQLFSYFRDDLLAPSPASLCPSPASSEGGTYSLVSTNSQLYVFWPSNVKEAYTYVRLDSCYMSPKIWVLSMSSLIYMLYKNGKYVKLTFINSVHAIIFIHFMLTILSGCFGEF